MKHTERLSVAQLKVTWDIVSFLPGMNTGKSTEAAAHRSVRKRRIPVTVSAMLLPALVLAVGTVIWVLKNYL